MDSGPNVNMKDFTTTSSYCGYLTNSVSYLGKMAKWFYRLIEVGCVERCRNFYREKTINGPKRSCRVWPRNWLLHEIEHRLYDQSLPFFLIRQSQNFIQPRNIRVGSDSGHYSWGWRD